ncbi:HEAT repeat domain-containing protein [Endozoicomonas arenosclerae]|uniref:HEAT repeat domain-containing protein n=1 Tax=Endozoicomonas arenosclerae TaxID=1633495 RepID=UPI000785005C|nr:HEAT repeat domain-containing protein [Endozoicomonas arenosclerae]
MVRTIECKTEQAIPLDEFYSLCDRSDLQSEEDLEKLVPALKHLANNRQFLEQYFCDYLNELNEPEHSFLPPVFMPRVGKSYIFRIVIWPVIDPAEWGNQLLYHYPHNHDVGFITCGYTGSGYHTDIYSFDYEHCTGLVGEEVDLEFQENTMLPPGKIMKYKAGTDMHIQYPPEELSVSLNVIKREARKNIVECSFDMEKRTVMGHSIKIPVQESVFNAVCTLGNENSKDRLVDIAQRHPFMRVRAAAWHALIEFNPADRDYLFSKAMTDEHAHVRAYANTLKRNIEKQTVDFASSQ